MKKIPLSNSHIYALVDDEDYDRLMEYCWRLSHSGYILSGTNIYMHNKVLGVSIWIWS